jgi:hypothetical protein
MNEGYVNANVLNLIRNSYENLHTFSHTTSNFKIYWGIPTSSCRKYKIDFTSAVASENNIIQNLNDSVRLVSTT